ncbi:NAD(P)H-dependent glycerol-3-phosphate dehydrogenase [Thiohalorhabdus sp.]|uniref:NAD(P)H-dependent glycerol-3-phosphate dehydrogenase n=1 Tax=Thiohalorhabdus sp. TaxID=3094134 RepID=UPI002FC2D807
MGADVAVIGAGAWGTALAIELVRCGHRVTLWHPNPDRAEAMQQRRQNADYLPGIPLPDGITATADMEQALSGCPRLVFAVPSHALRRAATDAAPFIAPSAQVVCASKGLEAETSELMHEVLAEVLSERDTLVGILSGPSFAQEVAEGKPTAVTVAAERLEEAEVLADWFRCGPGSLRPQDEGAGRRLSGGSVRVYSSDDRVGIELGGAVKNVIAIAAGIADGLDLGYNARAALITRGLAEMARLGEAWGGRAETFAGLAGLGDLVLTCTGPLSRNYQLGEWLGAGTALAEVDPVLWRRAEGVRTARALHHKARALEVDMPIAEQVYRVLYGGEAPHEAVAALLQRRPKPEDPPVSGGEA